MNRKILIPALLATTALAGCSLQRTEANQWGCSFGAGMRDTRNLKHAFAPGEKGNYSNDRLVKGPSDVRYYYIDSDPNTADQNARPIVVPARGSSNEGVGVVDVTTEVQVRFVFNERFCDWYINHGFRNDKNPSLNYEATDEASGWQNFLNVSMNQKLIEATRPVVRDVDYITLYTNGEIELPDGGGSGAAYEVLAHELSANLSRELKADLGNEYFCGPSYKFDGVIDGVLEGTGCPPLEVTVKSIRPVDDTLIQKLRDIVNNEEQQRKIESDTALAKEQTRAEQERAIATAQANQARAVAQAAADQATAIAQAEANQAIAVAQAKAGQQTAVAQAEADKAIKLAQQDARRAAQLAAAEADLAIADAEAPVAAQKAINQAALEAARATFCVELAKVGIDCALLQAAENSNYPPYGGGSGGTPPTLIVDGRT